MAYDDFQTLSNLQSQQSQFFGNEASKVADPYGYKRRVQASKSLDRLLANPGSIESSPFYRYLRNTAMNATRAGNAAGGFRNSGRGQLALQQAAQGSATKAFFPLAELYGKISGATNTLSPAAAALALSGQERGMDYAQMGAAARALADRQSLPGGSVPWWQEGLDEQYDRMLNGSSSGGALPYSSSGKADLPVSMGGSFNYNPKTDPYIQGLMEKYYPNGQPLYGATDTNNMIEQNYWGYE